MASKFFHVHHEFRAGKAQQWWETAQAAMAPGGGWDEAVAKNLEAGPLQDFWLQPHPSHHLVPSPLVLSPTTAGLCQHGTHDERGKIWMPLLIRRGCG